MSGVVRAGRNAGGRAYGYRPILGRPGELEIVEDEAAIIRRIYRAYVDGETPRSIAQALNAEAITPPRGNFWRASSLLGNPQRGNGILLNEIYAGRIIWNRVRMIRDPETGKRVSRPNAPQEYQRADAPQLRIIDDELFEAAQTRKAGRTIVGKRGQRKPRHALSGLLRCGCCGAGMSIKDRDRGRLRIICSQKKEAGNCSNGRSYYLDKIEACVVDTLKAKIGSRDAVAYYIRVYNDERRFASAEAIANKSRTEARLAEAQRALDRMVDALAAGTLTPEDVGDRIPQLRSARDRAKAELAAIGEPAKVVTLHPAAINDYLRNLDRLAEIIGADLAEGDDGIAQALRALVETVTIMPAPAGEAPQVRVAGHLESLLKLDAFDRRSSAGVSGPRHR